MSMISELVEKLRCCVEAYENSPYYYDGWIPVEDSFAGKKGEYLVTYHPCYWDDVSPEIKIGIDNFRGKTTWARKKYQRIVAWQPLPEPYKKDNK